MTVRKQIVLAEIEGKIRLNILDPQFSVATLVEEFDISRSYLHELICIKYNMNPHKLIETIRLDVALDLIGKNEVGMIQICKNSGYHNPKSLRSAFRKRLKMTPSECRKKLNASVEPHKEIEILKSTLWKISGENYRR